MTEPSQRPPIAGSPISVVLFAHALSTDTQASLQAWRQYLDTLARPYEIILIQETRPEAAPAASEEPTHIFPYDRSLGYRDALNDAIRSAVHPLLVFCSADLQYQPNDLDRMLKVIDQVDLITGYRAGGRPPLWRVLLDKLFGVLGRVLLGVPLEQRVCWLGSEGWGRRWVARWLFGVRVVDAECPFRLARREIFQRLPFQSGGSFVQVEMLAKANHLSCFLAEEPVAWTPPALAADDAIDFGQDARRVFHNPDFGPYDPLRILLAEPEA